VEALPKGRTSDVIGRQLLRSATSIGVNVVEAGAASSRGDFTNFFNHALKSANETKFWLGLLRDAGKAKKENVDKHLQETSEIAKIIASSIITLKKN
jgi:four helix bundle protein